MALLPEGLFHWTFYRKYFSWWS